MKIVHDVFPSVLRALQLDVDAIDREFLAKLDPYATVISHGKLMDRARVVITENPNRLIIAVDQPEGVRVMFDEPYAELFRHPVSPRLNPIGVLMSSGKFIVFQRDTGCGCGSRLRGWNPYRHLSSMNLMQSDNDPRE